MVQASRPSPSSRGRSVGTPNYSWSSSTTRVAGAATSADEDQTVGDVLAIGSGVGLFLIVCAAGVNWYRSRRRKRRAAAAAAASGRTAAQEMRPAQDLPSPASAEVVRSSNWMTDADLFQYNTGKRAQWGDTSAAGGDDLGGGGQDFGPTRGGMDDHGAMGTDKISF